MNRNQILSYLYLYLYRDFPSSTSVIFDYREYILNFIEDFIPTPEEINEIKTRLLQEAYINNRNRLLPKGKKYIEILENENMSFENILSFLNKLEETERSN